MVTGPQYPHFLYALVVTAGGQNSNTGEWTESTSAWEFKGACREETNGKGHAINGSDGKAIVFSSIIQQPKGSARIMEGTEMLVLTSKVANVSSITSSFITGGLKSGSVRIKGTCLKNDVGRLHNRVWI
jgi:hypothetical protein